METVRQIMAARAIYNIFKMTEFQLAISSRSLRFYFFLFIVLAI